MHSRFRTKGVTVTALAALLALLVVPATLLALPKPGAPGRSFRLMARAIGAIVVNRVYCGLSATGEVCVDSTGSSTIGGGYWPKGTPQQYVFNSGLQAAGIVDSAAGFAWAGDVTGAFFFDPKGTTQHGEQVEPIWNSQDAADRAAWPAAAYVPHGDAEADLYDPHLQLDANGKPIVAASEGDIWTLAWDGNPGQNAGRPHPLGIAVETRGMGWNFPAFNNDIVYFTYTFYNITSADPNDYLGIRPELRDEIAGLGVRFQQLNNAAFGVTIPFNGYTIKGFFANFSADMDVSSSAGSNYSSVNLPFSLGYVYQTNFQSPDNGAKLPPDVVASPFINGYGFVGVKYLKSPVDPNTGQELGIRLFSNTVNGGAFGDPGTVAALYRYVTGNVSASLGDGNCNYSPIVDHICYVKADGPADMRFFQSSGPQDLAPGGQGTIVVAYLFASAVKSGTCPAADCGVVLAGDPRFLSNATQLATNGANPIDTMTGFLGYSDANSDGVVQQSEFVVQKGSLLAKALVAQTVFDNKFLLPQSPTTPDFFLIPGDNQVTVVWRKSATENSGDLYYQAAKDPQVLKDPDGPGPLPAVLVNNLLYDPNYRKFDIEGYRVYRGRVDNPSSLKLLAQYDYNNTTMDDYLGVINPDPDCAPELGNQSTCAVTYDQPPPGAKYVAHNSYNVVSPFIQVKLGDRTLLATGDAIILAADTAVTGAASNAADLSSRFPEISDNGVPFSYVDKTAKNNLRYFYSVTAFDVNSLQSGPSSLESARVTKAVTPVHPSSNYQPDVVTTVMVGGVGRALKDPAAPMPSIDPATGEFSGAMPAANGAALGLVGSFVKEVVSGSGQFSARLDSLKMGQIDMTTCCGGGGPGVPAHYYWTVSNGASSTKIDLPATQDLAGPVTTTGLFNGITVNKGLGQRYGGGNTYSLLAAIKPTIQPIGYAGGAGQAMILGEDGFTSDAFGTAGNRYDGFRWYSGANESTANPTSGNCLTQTLTTACGAAGTTQPVGITNYGNAGVLAEAPLVYMPHAGLMINREWRNMEGIMGSAVRAGDFRVYWGAPGVVDSVIDLTNNVPLTFDSAGGIDPNEELGAGWAILNQSATTAAGSYDGRTGTLTPLDWACVKPFTTFIAGGAGFFPCTTEYAVSRTASLGPVAVGAGDNQLTGASNVNSVRSPNNNNGGNGFSMWIAGTISFFGQMTALPTNTTWTLRTYSGVIYGGGAGCANCNAGAHGAYSFNSQPRPMTAVGAQVVFNYSVAQVVAKVADSTLDLVHTVPDPYYITNGFERSTTGKVIKFVNLPDKAIVRIYSTSGVLVRVLEHTSQTHDGSMDWDVRNRNNQIVASGVYFYAIESGDARRVGRMTIVNFAQ